MSERNSFDTALFMTTAAFVPVPLPDGSPLDIECPLCHAPIGEHCNFTGAYLAAIIIMHAERIDKFFGGVPNDEQLGIAVANAIEGKLF